MFRKCLILFWGILLALGIILTPVQPVHADQPNSLISLTAETEPDTPLITLPPNIPIWIYPIVVFSLCLLFTRHFKPLGIAGLSITSLVFMVFYVTTDFGPMPVPSRTAAIIESADSVENNDDNFDFELAQAPTPTPIAPTGSSERSGITLDSLDAEQNKTLDAIISIGLARNVPEKYILAAIATGLAEDSLHNNATERDADSQNWRQERRMFYAGKWAQTGGSLNLDGSVNRFYDECYELDSGQSAGKLAADVQRPAIIYRGRFQQRMTEAEKLYLEWMTKKGQ